MGGASVETFSGEAQLKKSPCRLSMRLSVAQTRNNREPKILGNCRYQVNHHLPILRHVSFFALGLKQGSYKSRYRYNIFHSCLQKSFRRLLHIPRINSTAFVAISPRGTILRRYTMATVKQCHRLNEPRDRGFCPKILDLDYRAIY